MDVTWALTTPALPPGETPPGQGEAQGSAFRNLPGVSNALGSQFRIRQTPGILPSIGAGKLECVPSVTYWGSL